MEHIERNTTKDHRITYVNGVVYGTFRMNSNITVKKTYNIPHIVTHASTACATAMLMFLKKRRSPARKRKTDMCINADSTNLAKNSRHDRSKPSRR